VTHPSATQPLQQRLRELPWQRLGGLGAGALVALAAALAAAWYGAGLALLVLAGAGLLAAIGALWTSVRTLFGEVPMDVEDAYALAAPAGTDDQKRALLRALEDLEYERRVGKISEQDFAELGARFRTDAKRLLGLQGEAPAEERREGAPTPSQPEAGSSGQPRSEERVQGEERSTEDGARPSRESVAAARRKSCSACGAKNDPDAQFCKKCGIRLEARAGRARGRSSSRTGRRRS
jgi:ribosomal protein L40E